MRVVLLLLLLGTSLVGFTQTDWESVVNMDGRFRINAPAALTERVDTIETAVGSLVYHTFFHQTDIQSAENALYMLSYVDYPVGAMHSDSTALLQDFFVETTTAAADAVKGELLYAAAAELDNYPGQVWRIDYLDGGAVIKTRAFMVNQRYYALQTISLRERNLNESSERFLDSFELLSAGDSTVRGE